MIKAAFIDAISKVKEEIKTKTMDSIPFGDLKDLIIKDLITF